MTFAFLLATTETLPRLPFTQTPSRRRNLGGTSCRPPRTGRAATTYAFWTTSRRYAANHDQALLYLRIFCLPGLGKHSPSPRTRIHLLPTHGDNSHFGRIHAALIVSRPGLFLTFTAACRVAAADGTVRLYILTSSLPVHAARASCSSFMRRICYLQPGFLLYALVHYLYLGLLLDLTVVYLRT